MKLTSKILAWYKINRRDLPWRCTKDPYKIWISEVVLQQTRVMQGTQHYINFVKRFPDVASLERATTDEVLQYWKGLGYYSRALNLQIAAQQIRLDFHGEFPKSFKELQTLKGIGKYTAAAIASICFDECVSAVDGNYYRVFSRIFADDFDISASNANAYFTELTKDLVDKARPGDFNQAVMDLGAMICTPKKPLCSQCPLSQFCLAFQMNNIEDFPVKSKKVKVEKLSLKYYFVRHEKSFLVRRRDQTSIWKNLYEFPTTIPEEWKTFIQEEKIVQHKLTHRNLRIHFALVEIPNVREYEKYAQAMSFVAVDQSSAQSISFPKPLQLILERWGGEVF